MGRWHLFEFEDLRWFPPFLRNYETDFLRFLSSKTGMFNPAIPVINRGLKSTSTDVIIELGSGGGGPILSLLPKLLEKHPRLQVYLTDLYPNISAFEMLKERSKSIHYIKSPIDIRKIPGNLSGLRTLFLIFHHFKPEEAREILREAVRGHKPIAIFEGQERSFPSIIAMLFSPLTVLVTTPFIGPFKVGRIIFTYFIPLVPLIIMWDGVVSSLRTYSIKEMQEMISMVDSANEFKWEIGRKRSGPGVILYLLGIPKSTSTPPSEK